MPADFDSTCEAAAVRDAAAVGQLAPQLWVLREHFRDTVGRQAKAGMGPDDAGAWIVAHQDFDGDKFFKIATKNS